jgi:hypothetical protein
MRRLRSMCLSLLVCPALLVTARTACGQRAPLVGTVSRGAIGPAVQQPAPIGGLRTVPLSSARIDGSTQGRPVRSGDVYLPYDARGWRVADAPLPRGLAVESSDDRRTSLAAPRWIPTYERPRWVRDSAAADSPLWRSLIVTDVVCDFAGNCVERSQRVRAGWIARCDCYAFADGLNRVWRVEDRLPTRATPLAPSTRSQRH